VSKSDVICILSSRDTQFVLRKINGLDMICFVTRIFSTRLISSIGEYSGWGSFLQPVSLQIAMLSKLRMLPIVARVQK
jgi:hypothetical protein